MAAYMPFSSNNVDDESGIAPLICLKSASPHRYVNSLLTTPAAPETSIHVHQPPILLHKFSRSCDNVNLLVLIRRFVRKKFNPGVYAPGK